MGWADGAADTAADAFVRQNIRFHKRFTFNGICRTDLCAFRATNAIVRYIKFRQLHTFSSGTFIDEMGLEFIAEFMERAQHHVRGSPTQSAEGALLNVERERFNPLQQIR